MTGLWAKCRVAKAEEAARKAAEERAEAAQRAAVAEAKAGELQRALDRAEERARTAQKQAAARSRVPIQSLGSGAAAPDTASPSRHASHPCVCMYQQHSACMPDLSLRTSHARSTLRFRTADCKKQSAKKCCFCQTAACLTGIKRASSETGVLCSGIKPSVSQQNERNQGIDMSGRAGPRRRTARWSCCRRSCGRRGRTLPPLASTCVSSRRWPPAPTRPSRTWR